MPVDRTALYEKLEKMGLSMKAVYRENHATVAVEEFVAYSSEGVEIVGCECDQAEVESMASRGPALSPGSLVLTAEEVAYMVLDFARTQGGER